MNPISLKNVIVFIALVLFAYAIATIKNHMVVNILAALIATVFIFSLIVRKKLAFKPFFVSPFNLLTTKYRKKQEFDLPKELLFEKLQEVLTSAGFKVITSNKETGDIFATSSMSFSSWGENLYISLHDRNGQTAMYFCSTTFNQIYSWGKNERNFKRLFHAFEESLII
jgi:hypothetical protein